MDLLTPATPEELAYALRESASADKRIELIGKGSKRRAGGASGAADVQITTARLDRVLQYEPKDLTVSVQPGLPYAQFTEMLAKDGYMVPLDPPFAANATLGGAISANSSGPRRRVYGSARDLVIGMQFATLEGKLIQTGGMVVKNVAGLDMGKLLIGSLGTLAAITVLNFKLIPKPHGSRTFVFEFPDLRDAIALRDKVIRSVLQPVAIDLLNPAAAGRKGWVLAIGVNGNEAVLRRYTRELSGGAMIEDEEERAFWHLVQEFTARFVAVNPEGAVVRSSVPLAFVGEAVGKLPGAVVARAGNGVIYSHVTNATQAGAALRVGKALMEFGPASREASLDMWPNVDSGFAVMQRIKEMFDPKKLLNRGRFYGRL
ncbi:MAG TPA: FAD-binding oxidoreductase [Bryobacteraceae bacterium]|nr:FAD-binding oxidoreductase [Bryobacteraceae bacterium]